ncbi:MAG: penicillin-binding protein 2 [Ruminococcus sp.]|nr:penicillin-binding protein 2 [Ruminococcus sp.]
MRKFGENRIIAAAGTFFVMFSGMAARYYMLAEAPESSDIPVQTAAESRYMTINVRESQGTIYDRNMVPLVNSETEYVAAAVPELLEMEETAQYAVDKESFCRKFSTGEPFTFVCTENAPDMPGLTVFEMPVRYTADQPAQHIIGYISDDSGVSGIEYAYDPVLRGGACENSVTYSIDGQGHVLLGSGKSVVRSRKQDTGIVTTIDIRIQRICEENGAALKKGAVVVTDISDGDILAMASFPEYSWDDIGAALESEDSPLIDRALYSYSVGSVFKLVTACEAINEGWEGNIYTCDGSIDVYGQQFNCHKADGHGMQTMTEAVVNSCNTYFISLSGVLDPAAFRELAHTLGFGKENYLCAGMTGSAGVLPSERELLVPAEFANFSFGQGRLTATPLQIGQLSAAIANGGEMPILRLIKGITIDGETVGGEKLPVRTRVMDEETAGKLRDMMTAAVSDNKGSNARIRGKKIAAKTSTAQTGRFDGSGEELCHGWITGFFPADAPEYAVTVLAEDGGYGNEAAAPVFREIVRQIAELDKEKQ